MIPSRENRSLALVAVALSGSPKLTVLPLRSPIALTSRGATTSSVSGARRVTSGVRFVQSGSSFTLERRLSSVTTAKSAMSDREALARPVGEVGPTIALPAAPLSLSTATKSLAMRLAVRSSGSARMAKGLRDWGACDCGAALIAEPFDCGAGLAAITALAGADLANSWPALPRQAPCHSMRLPLWYTGCVYGTKPAGALCDAANRCPWPDSRSPPAIAAAAQKRDRRGSLRHARFNTPHS